MRLSAAFLTCATLLCAQDGFHAMFDGKTLKGWDGDPRLWSVRNGAITGSTDGISLDDNSFLIYKKPIANFELKTDVRLRNHNSGIQFRSEQLPHWVVRGPQADMAEGNWWGSLYDEKGKRGVMVNGWKGKAEKVVKPNDWNHYELMADGDHVVIKVNGLTTVDVHDPQLPKTGIIALQLHRGPGMLVEFKNLVIKELP